VAPPGRLTNRKQTINNFNLLVVHVKGVAEKKTIPSGARFSLHFKQNIRQKGTSEDIITVDTAQLRTHD
jgi:hypothetical protein